ncbi:Uncharacterized conserved protein [Elusimicrobium minutum Pei191]|uniref:Uncharacterized conserved protein n=1 Tax=Elusimicrobium minutum (strain Pei191) TaxID=445932 RepID=B2KCP4_ELUMP|nr:DUF192 domain-containing protein [Elusimicrobium minutum]ACC98290.1 Uncharacterized conserved protein [Elusimicrobium minutum Pei191]
MKAVNQNNNFLLADNVEVAAAIFDRMKGLLGKKDIPQGYGLLIKKCNSIHMFFMRFAIDAVFLSKEGEVLHILQNFKPWRISKVVFGASSALELPAGTIGNNVKKGDFIVFK